MHWVRRKYIPCKYKTKNSQLIIFMNRIINIFVNRPKDSRLTVSQGKVFCFSHSVILLEQYLSVLVDRSRILLRTRVHHPLGVSCGRCQSGLSQSREYHGAGAGERGGPVATHLGGPGALSPWPLCHYYHQIIITLSHPDTRYSHTWGGYWSD